MEYTCTISARGKDKNQNIKDFLESEFPGIHLQNIDSVFGFSEFPSKIYGGRPYLDDCPELVENDIEWMYDNNIGFRIPLTSTIATEELYREEIPFLEKYHKKGNSVIVVKNNLAKWIRRDFPLYKIEASVIKEISDVENLKKSLEIFDTAVPLPAAFNNNLELLDSLSKDIKSRIRLFLVSACAFECPARICYGFVSKFNAGLAFGPDDYYECSQKDSRYNYKYDGVVHTWNKEPYLNIGINKFKILRNKKTNERPFGNVRPSEDINNVRLSAY